MREKIYHKVEDTGWLARDKDDSLYFYKNKPVREKKSWFWGRKGDKWIIQGAWRIPVGSWAYRDITWESEPVEVSIEINELKPKK